MISDKQDNRNIISLEDLKDDEKNAENTEKNERKASPYLSDDEMKEYLERYRGKVPSVILRDVYEMLKGRRVSEKQIDRIVERVKSMLNSDNQLSRIDDIYRKLESLEKLLRQEILESKTESKEKKAEIEGDVEGKVGTPEIKGKAVFDSSKFHGGDVVVYPEQVHAHSQNHADVIEKKEKFTQAYPRYPAKRDRDYRWESYENYAVSDEPRLTRIPSDAKSIMLLLKWIEFLMEKVGYEGLEDVLNYYVDVYWISEDVLMSVLRYARGIKLYHENSDWRPIGYMNVQDHLMSLLYIEALRTGRFERNLIMEVEKDLYRMKKEVAELHGI
jgi:flagellar protein FlaD